MEKLRLIIAHSDASESYVEFDADHVYSYAPLTIAPLIAQPPFVLDASAQGQKVIGLNADQMDGYHAEASGADAHILATGADGGLTLNGPFSINPPSGPPSQMNIGSYAWFGSLWSSGASLFGYNVKPYQGSNNKVIVANTNASIGYAYVRMDGYHRGMSFHIKTGSVTAGDEAENEAMKLTPNGALLIGRATATGTDAIEATWRSTATF